MIGIEQRQWAKRVDFWLPTLALAIGLLGMLAIHSAESKPGTISGYVLKQFIGLLIGFAFFLFLAKTDYRAVMASARTLYIVNLVLLVLVMVIGSDAKGAQRWISFGPLNLQPSEIAKVLLILTLGAFIERHRLEVTSWPTLLRSLLHIAVPMALIFKQPDLGTSLVLIALWYAMTFIAGARLVHLALVTAVGLSVFAIGWKIGVVKDYQKARLSVFLNPEADPSGDGYHITQSKKAVGSGQVFGKGLFKGDMKRLQYVPENHTDFIFTVVAEETGFVGSTVLLGLYLLLIGRMLIVALRSEDPLGQGIATGVAAVFTFHTAVNIGMNIGVMPVAGVPLPLFSYGPSSVIASLSALGLVESVYIRRHKISF